MADSCVSRNAKLDYQLGYLIIRKETTTKIHLSELSVLILESTAISLTAYLLNELNKKKIKVIFCDEKRNPTSELIPLHGSHDTSIKKRIKLTGIGTQKMKFGQKLLQRKFETK